MDFLSTRRLLDRLLLIGYGGALVVGAGYGAAYLRLPRADAAPLDRSPAGSLSWRQSETPDPRSWEVFVGAPAGPIQDPASGGRFRLAGTFFLEDVADSASSQRCAVLDDRDRGRQFLVREGEAIDTFEVVSVQPNRVVLRDGTQERVLTLEFLGPALAEPPRETPPTASTEVPWDQRVIEETRFGKRIAEDRWIMHRSELLRYRQELLDDPERLAKLFMSMKAVREDGQIEGYRLHKEGEEEFYTAIGLQEDDVVRRTNSMKMTKRERAEYFIREFVNDRLNVVVLDVERNGEPMKLIYYIR